jgi:hypothetical protein
MSPINLWLALLLAAVTVAAGLATLAELLGLA